MLSKKEPPIQIRYSLPISAGAWHSLSLLDNGQVVGWGDDVWGRASGGEEALPPGRHYIAISAGSDHSLGLLDNGQVVEWGHDPYGQASGETRALSPGRHYIAISAGEEYSLGLLDNGHVVGGGNDQYGRASGGESALPPGRYYIAISAGGRHSLGLLDNGQVVGWGDDRYGQASEGKWALPPRRHYIAISAGSSHSLGLVDNGQVVGWGDDIYGQASGGNRALPPGRHYIAISAGYHHSLGLLDNGQVVGWGNSPHPPRPWMSRAAGSVRRAPRRHLPAARRRPAGRRGRPRRAGRPGGRAFFSPRRHYIAISAGYHHSLGLLDNGQVVEWGDDSFGQASGGKKVLSGKRIASGHHLIPETRKKLIERRQALIGDASDVQVFASTIIMQPGSRWIQPETYQYFTQTPRSLFEKVMMELVGPHRQLRNQEWKVKVICNQRGEEYRKDELIRMIQDLGLESKIKPNWTKKEICNYLTNYFRILESTKN